MKELLIVQHKLREASINLKAIGLDLTLHVDKGPINLVTQSKYIREGLGIKNQCDSKAWKKADASKL
jgi:hypothetical protein